jgi:histidyl-tRNA synthetase
VKIEVPRGMRDIEWQESIYIELIKQKFIDAAQRFNFEIMEPSPLEMLSTLEAKSGTSISNETYSFEDKGGRKVGLRFDFTVGLSRFVCQRRDLKMPTKLASFGGVWRYDEPQAGRYRFFHQWDIEIFGSPSEDADSEIIEFTAKFLDLLGLSVVVQINHRRIIETYLNEVLGISEMSTIAEMLRAVDKLSRKTPRQLIDEYRGKLDVTILQKLFEFSSFKGRPEECPSRNILENFDAWKSTTRVFDMLRSRNVKNVQLNFGTVRGLDYYSGLVFEIFDPSTNIGALAGGGRYDKLPEIFGRNDIGATGAAGGVERIMAAMETHKLLNVKPKSLICVVYSSEQVKNYAIRLASNLRSCGYKVDYALQAKSAKRQINDAISRNAAVVIVFEQEEMNRQLVTVRNDKGIESKIRIENLMEKIDEMGL